MPINIIREAQSDEIIKQGGNYKYWRWGRKIIIIIVLNNYYYHYVDINNIKKNTSEIWLQLLGKFKNMTSYRINTHNTVSFLDHHFWENENWKWFHSHTTKVQSACGNTFKIYLSGKTEKAVASHSSTLAWKIPWMEEPGGLQSMGSLRVGHNWATSLHFTFWEKTIKFTEEMKEM